MREPHGDRTMTVWPPYDVSMFELADVSVLSDILFHAFEVPSQLKMRSYTRLVHECPRLHEDHTATERSSHGLLTEAARAAYDIHAISMHGCRDSTIYV